MQIKLYKFAKKSNSTAQPGSSALVATVNANIKDNCSIVNPVLLLDYDHNDFNYIYMADFGGRYYFVDDIVLAHGLIEVQCSIDALATYKTNIGSTSMYITRSSASSDGNIVDNLYPIKTNATVDTTSLSMGWSYSGFDSGSYVLGVQGATAASTNAVIYFQLTPSQLSTILHAFYANSGSTWWGNMAKGVINSLNKIDDFIVSCRWYPFTFPTSGSQKVWIGSYETTVTADILDDYPNMSFNKTFTLTSHPQASSRGTYLNHAPFSRYTFHHDLIGTINLPSEICAGQTVHASITPDFTTGQALFELYVSPVNVGVSPFYSTYIQIGTDIGLNGANVNLSGFIGSATSTIGTAMAGNWLGTAASIGSAVTEAVADPGRHSSSGGYINIASTAAIIRSIHYPVADRDNANQGSPYCKMSTPSSLAGFIRAENPHVVTSGTDTETNMINSMIEAGIYYE